jgi:hypothetical protein
MDDFIEDISSAATSNLTLIIIVSVCVLLGLVLVSVLLRLYISSMQNRILEKDAAHSRHHVRAIGLLPAMRDLRRLRRAHADLPDVCIQIDEATARLRTAGPRLLYDAPAVYAAVSDQRVRRGLMRLYGVPAEEPGIRMGGVLSLVTPVFATSSLSMSSVRRGIQRCNPTLVPAEGVIGRTLMICAQANMRSGLFYSQELQLVVEASLREVGEPMCWVAMDSIDFVYILGRKFESILGDADLELALLIAVIAWHLFMKTGREKGGRIARFFAVDGTQFQVTVRNLLVALYVHRVEENKGKEKWKRFAATVLTLAETAVIARHHEVIAKFALISGALRRDGGFPMNHAITFIQLLFNFSMLSYCLQPPDISSELIRIINPDIDDAATEIRDVMACMSSELIEPTISVLKPLVEPEFFTEMAV